MSLTLIANSITLTPGTVTIEVGEQGLRASSDDDGDAASDDVAVRRTLFIHVLHFNDIESVRREILRLERLAIKAFGSLDDLPLVEAELAALSASATGGASSGVASDEGSHS